MFVTHASLQYKIYSLNTISPFPFKIVEQCKHLYRNQYAINNETISYLKYGKILVNHVYWNFS